MPLYPPQDYRNTKYIHRQGIAADRPAAADVLEGTLYFSTDTVVLERSNGVVWSNYSGGGGGGGTTGLTGSIGPPGLDAEESDSYSFIPGPQGINGINGINGTSGTRGINGLDGEDIEPFIIPGPQGLQGIQGIQGLAGSGGSGSGSIGPQGLDGEDSDFIIIPGPQGNQGVQGVPGTSIGVIGPRGLDGDDGEDGYPLPIIGPRGLTGITGNNGTIGPPGLDSETEEQYIIPGPIGIQGIQGIPGTSGSGGSSIPQAILPYFDQAENIEDSAILPNIPPFYPNKVIAVNFSTVNQTITAAAARAYIAGSSLRVPNFKLAQCILRWKIGATKSAGAAATTIDVCFGTAGTTADTARLSFIKPAGTAVADEATIDIEAVIRGPLTTTGIVVGTFRITHNLAATGWSTLAVNSLNSIAVAFDLTIANTVVGLCITSGDTGTLKTVTAEMIVL